MIDFKILKYKSEIFAMMICVKLGDFRKIIDKMRLSWSKLQVSKAVLWLKFQHEESKNEIVMVLV